MTASEATREARELAKVPPEARIHVYRNMRDGLLCACNACLIPYFGPAPGEHGTLTIAGIVHGYDHCE